MEVCEIERQFKDRTGETNTNRFNQSMTIVRYGNANDIDIKFDDGTLLPNRSYKEFKNGIVKNPYMKRVFGVGFFGQGIYSAKINGKNTLAYNCWRFMLKRCYDKKIHIKQPTYANCTVCAEWHNFQNFALWYEENYYQIENEQMQLDKDILIKGNKIYSPDTCVFVSGAINKLFVNRALCRGDLPVGVRRVRGSCKYAARCSFGNGSMKHLGVFNTPEEAFCVYKKAKENHIKNTAIKYRDKIPEKLYYAMCNYKVEITD